MCVTDGDRLLYTVDSRRHGDSLTIDSSPLSSVYDTSSDNNLSPRSPVHQQTGTSTVRLSTCVCLCLSVCVSMCLCMCVSDSDVLCLSPSSYLGLLDRTRMFLCLFMMTLFVFNPFSGIVKLGREFATSADSGGRAAGRTLLNSDSNEAGMSVSLSVCLCERPAVTFPSLP